MKKRIAITGIGVLALLLFTLVSCDIMTVDDALVGKWGIYGVQAYEFTTDGDFVTGVPGVMSITYKYSASNGTGKYWTEIAPSAKVNFTYSINGDSLEMEIEGALAINLTRIPD